VPDDDRFAKLRGLRQESGASLQECKRALEAAGGDPAAALLLLERTKVEEVRRHGGCSEDVAVAALKHANGSVERAVEIAKAPREPAVPEFERVTQRARTFLSERAPSLGLHELRDVLPHARSSRARTTLARALEFHSIMVGCDIETFLEHEENDPAATQAALAEVGAANLARYLKLAIDGPQHMEARARLEREFFGEEEALLVAVLSYIERNAQQLS
jgi:hypothetical protein